MQVVKRGSLFGSVYPSAACVGAPLCAWRVQPGPCLGADRAALYLQRWTSARPARPAAPSSASTTRAATSAPARPASSPAPTAAAATVSAFIPVRPSTTAGRSALTAHSRALQPFL